MKGMETTAKWGIPNNAAADARALIDQLVSGKPQDPSLVQRVRAEASRITEEIRRRHGSLDIGVSLIRELRGDLPPL